PLTPRKKEAEIVASFHAGFDKGDTDAARKIIDQNGEVMIKHAFFGCCQDFLKYSIAGDQDKESSSLAELKLISDQIAATSSDESVKDIAAYLTALPPDERKRELELINDYFTAYGLRNHSKFSEALPIFERISPEFERRGNGIFQVFSLLDAATCYSGNRDMLTSIRLINESL